MAIAVPELAVHYHRPDRWPFLNLSDLGADGSPRSSPHNPPACPALLRAPHYFVLGESPWFRGLAEDMRAVRLPISELPYESASFTYPDSFTAMQLAPQFGLPYEPRPYHGQVFRMDALDGVVQAFGLPTSEEPVSPESYAGHVNRPFEKYTRSSSGRMTRSPRSSRATASSRQVRSDLVPSLGAVLDYHLHLWEHGPRPLDATLEQVAAYCARAEVEGVTEIAITEHFYRFRQADVVGPGWFDDDPNPALRAGMVNYVDHERGADLDHYVEVALAAKQEGLPVVLGLEVDYFRDRMDRVAGLLDGYPFDVLLGSVHWLGAWGFDNREIPAFAAEWDARSVESVWHDYTTSLEELADSRTCDVLAHPDLCKIFGHVPAVPDEFYDRMAEAAARSGMAAEVSSAGWRKPVGEAYPAPPLLARFKDRGVPVTTASDAHRLDRVGERRDDVRTLVRSAGYDQLRAFAGRQPHDVAL